MCGPRKHDGTSAQSNKSPVFFRGQNFSKLRESCVKRGVLFEDPTFPASSKSVCRSHVDDDIVWLRPGEISKAPKLFGDGISSDDLMTGDQHNVWLVPACTALALNQKLWAKVVPDAKVQEWGDKATYAGIFHFNFWRQGEWVDVVIDDRLPTKDKQLIFLYSKQKKNFWSALLEKAYAKLFGDYEALQYVDCADALVDFTGGVAQKIALSRCQDKGEESQVKLFDHLLASWENKAIMNCYIKSQKQKEGNVDGLVVGQGYIITKVMRLELKQKNVIEVLGSSTFQMIRLMNPHTDQKWTGPWSESSTQWKTLPVQEWTKLGLDFKSDQEFWIDFKSLQMAFTDLTLCHFFQTGWFTLKKTWHEAALISLWSHPAKTGGNDVSSPGFLCNPQFCFDLTKDEGNELVISLEQKDLSEDLQVLGDKMNVVGFYIFQVENNRKYRVHVIREPVYKSDFDPSRNVYGQCDLPKGRYVLIPCCVSTTCAGQFLVRVYTGSKAGMREMLMEAPKAGCCVQYHVVTTVKVLKIEGLVSAEKQTMNPYVIILCEGEKVQSHVCENTSNPFYNLEAIFYRKSPLKKPIVVQVFNRSKWTDSYVCEAKIENEGHNEAEQETNKTQSLTLNFFGRKKEANVQKPGQLYVEITSSRDLEAL